ncbi:MAG: rhomboid family intramembrane serine protease [Geobacteraceae bacterium]|nr:rhomboid family intramembrane serine protease [Geobacteraceae bacterium]
MDDDKEFSGVVEDGWLPVSADWTGNENWTITARREVQLWALVLESRYVPCRMARKEAGWVLMVPPGYYEIALEELRLFEQENLDWPPVPPKPRPLAGNTLATLSILLLVATFHNITQIDGSLFGAAPIDWFGLGSADAARIQEGEWWRAITALTLHSGLKHLLGNLLIGGVFIAFLCHDLGSGLAWSLLLASGVSGNLANAWLQPLPHDSVGASTLVFGAVGLLGSIRVARDRRLARSRLPLPLAGALALLALLGTEGERTDLGAHLFGFAFGVVIGFLAEYLLEKRGAPGEALNALLALIALAVPVAGWWIALV